MSDDITIRIPAKKASVASAKTLHLKKVKTREVEEFTADPADDDDSQALVKPVVSMSAVQALIQKKLHINAFVPKYKYWLKVDPELARVLGSAKRGIPYGKVMELHGIEHGGKTLIGIIMGAIAQNDGAAFIYVDLEHSYDPQWIAKLGGNPDDVLLIEQKLVMGEFRKQKKDEDDETYERLKAKKDALGGVPEMQSIESIFLEVQAGIYQLNKAGYKKIYLLVDSIAFMQTAMQNTAAEENTVNMRTNADLPMFLAKALPKWAAFAAAYNVLIVFINQLRDVPGAMYGPSERTPGGRQLRHTCHVRGRVSRVGPGLRQGTKKIGIIGKIKNVKNKSGNGSVEGEECGFRVRWDKPKAEITFMTGTEVDKLKKDTKKKE